jgi:hypothetical protein
VRIISPTSSTRVLGSVSRLLDFASLVCSNNNHYAGTIISDRMSGSNVEMLNAEIQIAVEIVGIFSVNCFVLHSTRGRGRFIKNGCSPCRLVQVFNYDPKRAFVPCNDKHPVSGVLALNDKTFLITPR